MSKNKQKTSFVKKSEIKDIKDRFSEVKRLIINSYCAYDALPDDSQLDDPKARMYLDSVVLPYLQKLEELVKDYVKKNKFSRFNPAE